MEKPALWTKNFIAGTGISFLLVLNYYLLMIIMSEYSTSQYHVSSSSAGLCASMFVFGALAARFFSAKLMELLGAKKLMTFGIVFEIIASFMYFFSINMWILLLIRFVHGVSYGMASTSVSTVVTSMLPKHRHGEGVGYFMLSITIGAAIGPFVGMFLINHGGYSYIFLCCTAVALLCFVASLTLNPKASIEKNPRQETSENHKKRKFNNIFETKAVPISIVCAGIYFCYSGIISFLTPYSKQTDLQSAASFFFIVYSLVILVTRPFTGRLFDQKGDRFIMIPAFTSFFIGMILLGTVHSGSVLLLSSALIGFGIGVIQSSGLAIAVNRTPIHRLNYANSTFYIFIDAGTGIGPFFLGFLVPAIGYRGMYLSLAVVTVLFFLLYLIVSKNKK